MRLKNGDKLEKGDTVRQVEDLSSHEDPIAVVVSVERKGDEWGYDVVTHRHINSQTPLTTIITTLELVRRAGQVQTWSECYG